METEIIPIEISAGSIDFIGRQTRISGGLIVGQLMRIDGIVEGEVTTSSQANSKIIVGRTGYIKGSIRAAHIVVSGSVEGDLFAEESIHVTPYGRFVGTLKAPKIKVERGALIRGSFEMEIPQDNPLRSKS